MIRRPDAPGALDPLPVGALVGQRLVARPAGEARPALRAVRADRAAGREEVLDHRAGAVGVVVGAVRSATVTPYGLHGRPQWKRPPRNSKAPRWMWSSRKPRTRAVGLGPLNGVPVTFTSTSGKVAQPWAGCEATSAGGRGDLGEPAERADGRAALPVDTFVSRTRRRRRRSTLPVRRRARAWRSATTVSSAPALGMRPSGP